LGTRKDVTTQADSFVFVGTNGHVRAVDKRTGADVWEVSLPDTGFELVSLLYDSGVLFAASQGHLFALNPENGEILWRNELKGLGNEHVVLASSAGSTDPVPFKASVDKEKQEDEDLEEGLGESDAKNR